MRKLYTTLAAATLAATMTTALADHHTTTSNQHFVSSAKQQQLSAQQVLQTLEQGNQRYVSGKTIHYNQRNLGNLASKKGQAPLAFVFNCVDSRSVPEVIFNQPVGSLFVSRIAGNVIDNHVLGSMEFATKYAGSKLVVVMGHTQCGAVAGACKGVKNPEKLKGLLNKIKPAVKQVAEKNGHKPTCNDKEVNQIAKQNVIDQMHALVKDSPTLGKMVKDKKIMLVGAMHNLTTGKVQFFNSSGKKI